MPDNQIETKQAILNAEKSAVKQAGQEREAAVRDAKQLERDTCRSLMAAVENLKQELKKAGSKDEKAALQQAIKEAEAAGRQTISRAKKNAEIQIKIALEQEKESIRQAKAEKDRALQELKLKTGPATIKAGRGTLPDSKDSAVSAPDADTGNPEPAQPSVADEIPGKSAEEASPPAPAVDKVLQSIESPAGETPESAGSGRRASGYDDILRSLEEIGRKLEESRKTRMELAARPDENSAAADISQAPPPGASTQVPAGQSGEEVAEPAQPEPAALEETMTAGKAPDELAAQPQPAGAGLFEGRVRIIIQNPSSAAVKAFGEKLKRIEDVKMLLFGGSADEGVQVVLMVLKPVPLEEKIEQTGQVEIVSSTPSEITLRFKT